GGFWHGQCSGRLPTTGGILMSRVAALLPLLSLLAGCKMFEHKDRYYTYCDATGCYACDDTGCRPNGTGGGNTTACPSNAQCQAGCYCDVRTGQCKEAGFCDKDSDCSGGMVCDTTRHSCQPAAGGGGGSCSKHDDCPSGQFCNPSTHSCLPSWGCP